eukprot:PhM_4_TR16249/c0_g1_i1/m.34786
MWLLGRGTRPMSASLRQRAPNPTKEVVTKPNAGPNGDLMPVGLNDSPISGGNHDPLALALQCDERRIAREKATFEDMLVFKGGAVSDSPTLNGKLIFRDFIHNMMYHPRMGYHPKMCRKYKDLVTSGFFEPLAFSATRGQQDYEYCVERLQEATPTFISTSQLFYPTYSYIMAEYMLNSMRAKFHPNEPLIMYEFGAGTGQLGLGVLDFLAEHHPEVYANCEYHFIDLNPVMTNIQRSKLIHHHSHVRLHNISAFNWTEFVPQRCFVLGFDLLNSMPHDFVVWSRDGAVYEQHIQFMERNNLNMARERWFPATDPVILRYLHYSGYMQEKTYHALKVLCLTEGHENIDPPRWRNIEPNIYDPHLVIASKVFAMHNPFRQAFLPTGTTLFFEMLAKYFPRHHLVLGDWNSVVQPISGHNGPVVQAKIRLAKDVFIRRFSPNILHNGGMVDICFPTDFEDTKKVYHAICGEDKEMGISTQPEFMAVHGGSRTQMVNTRTGFNPLLEDFHPYSLFTSHHPAER